MKDFASYNYPIYFILAIYLGCSNPFNDTYVSKLESWPSGQVARVLPVQGDVKLMTSLDIKNDAERMLENGYLLLGRSKFRETQININEAKKFAREINASIVLVERKFADAVTEAVPINEWIPARQETLKSKSVVVSGPNAGKVIETEITKEIQGEFRTKYVPQTMEYYDYAATYWGKLKPPIFGVFVNRLDNESRQRLKSNRGVIVRAVIRDSPAFKADIIPNDIITSFADQAITDIEQLFDLVLLNNGGTVDVEFIRDDVLKKIAIRLNEDRSGR